MEKLPLSESINQVVQMEHCNSKDCKNMYERYSIPNIENGYYYFADRQNGVFNHDDNNLNDRISWNFTLAILDIDTNMIYYYELDT